jgi:hypothetical protein
MSEKSSGFFLGCVVTGVAAVLINKASKDPRFKTWINHTKEDFGLNSLGSINVFDKLSIMWQRIKNIGN